MNVLRLKVNLHMYILYKNCTKANIYKKHDWRMHKPSTLTFKYIRVPWQYAFKVKIILLPLELISGQ